MEEEIMSCDKCDTQEENVMTEEVTEEDGVNEELDALRKENVMLRRQYICAKLSIPDEIAEDVMLIAENRCGGDVSFEEAAAAAYKRILRCAVTESPVTTGVKIKKNTGGSDALRAAFGLKN